MLVIPSSYVAVTGIVIKQLALSRDFEKKLQKYGSDLVSECDRQVIWLTELWKGWMSQGLR